ncbi:MAG: hydroxymethylbilane synthase [Methanobacteriota archaeon]|nr:MAG: hydroxymethylbilane synthase [Euryarchaeota archaeon]
MIRIGTRKSRLALAQANLVRERVEELGFETQLITSTSKGDLDLISPLTSLRGTGIFTGNLEKMLLQNQIDIAVHSLKDMALENPNGLEIRAVLPRESPEDVLLIKEDKVISKFPLLLQPHSRIGTGSLRRQAQIKEFDKSTILLDIRGNIDRRIELLKEGYLDGIILAAAVLQRMDIHIPNGFTAIRLPLFQFPTAPGQGTIAVQVRKGELQELQAINHVTTWQAITIERELFGSFPGGCNNGVGITVKPTCDGLILFSFYVQNGIHRSIMAAKSESELKEKFYSWIINKPINRIQTRRTAIVFTDEATGKRYVQKLEQHGIEAISLPLMAWSINYPLLMDSHLQSAWKDADWIIVTSKHAVPFLSKLKTVYSRTGFRTAIVGSATADEMREYGLPVHFVSTSGVQEIKKFLKSQKGKILYLSGKHVSDPLDEFSNRLTRIQIYQTHLLDVSLPFKPDYAVVFSPRSAIHLLNHLGKDSAQNWIAIGNKTASALSQMGVKPLVAREPTPEGVIETIIKEA